MPGFLLHQGAVVQCTHAAPSQAVTGNVRVLVMGMPLVTFTDMWTVAGCPFQIPFGVGTKPQPCVRIQWLQPATRVFVNGQPAVVQTGPGAGNGICLSIEQIPQGPPVVSAMQTRVTGM